MSEYRLTSLTLSGFRAYLKPKTFDLSKKPSLAVFAPNGRGKSSIIDGLEFFFSDDGTLRRLGTKAVSNLAGVVALPHNLAEEQGIASFVEVDFKRGNEKHDGKRLVDALRERPAAATDVRGCFVVDPIIRGYELRAFVEKDTPHDRYKDIARWLDLGALADVQRDLAALRKKVKASADSDTDARRLDGDLAKKTGQALKKWDGAAALAHANSLIAALDKSLALAKLASTDVAYLEVAKRAKAEENQLGLAGLRQLLKSANAIYAKSVGEQDAMIESGLILQVAAAQAEHQKAVEAEAHERAAASSAIFEQVWKASAPLFLEGAKPIDACPVCDTPIAETKAGSAEAIRAHIASHQKELADYAKAKKDLDDAAAKLTKLLNALTAALRMLADLLTDEEKQLAEALTAYLNEVEEWKAGDLPASTSLQSLLVTLATTATGYIERIETAQGDATYAKTKSMVDALIAFSEERELIDRKQAELGKLSDSLNQQAKFVSSEIRKKVQAVLDTLEGPMNEIYREIQRDATLPVRLELPPENNTNQQNINLVVDFDKNRQGVAPLGYLSDSQIHSLALALRLAAIKRCNKEAPIVVLDDVVTSYDADHRLAIAALLAKEFDGMQMIVVTHDERFFLYLKDHLTDQSWSYARILTVDAGHGPRFQDHRVTDEMIEARWTNGESAANDMRQAEEEWLLGICRDFGVDVRIRSVERAYSYERAELAAALASFLVARGLKPPAVAGVKNRFLTSLQTGTVENFGSHFQDAQYGAGSQGDEKVRWNEFVEFRGHFVCPSCSKARFKRGVTYNKPSCMSEKCETVFAFKEPVKQAVA